MSFKTGHDLDSSLYPHREAHMSNCFAKVYTSFYFLNQQGVMKECSSKSLG